MFSRWWRSRRALAALAAAGCLLYYLVSQKSGLVEPIFSRSNSTVVPLTSPPPPPLSEHPRREDIAKYTDQQLARAVQEERGAHCDMPVLDPFAKEIMQFNKPPPTLHCRTNDWVQCHLSQCGVVEEILNSTSDVVCTYSDVIHHNDHKYTLQKAAVLRGAARYTLKRSDHVKVSCTGYRENSLFSSKWVGVKAGFRTAAVPRASPPGRESSYNVLILGLDSTSHAAFLRHMPTSHKVLTEELNATIMSSYNILGDGTPAALFPLLTGYNELELPDLRRAVSKDSVDGMPWLFYKLRDDGYRTAYFEDMPEIGTFTYRFNGFQKQPADHYLRSYYLEQAKLTSRANYKYCSGDKPRFQLMLNLSEQFMLLPGKKFCFTFIADITHDDSAPLPLADAPLAATLRRLLARGLDDTLLMVMSDHGSRFSNVRGTYQGKLEERLPILALRLPDRLRRDRPDAQRALEHNARVLMTAHDLHATVLDVMGLQRYYNKYSVQGASLPRGLSLLQPIPKERGCGAAGVEEHWCACLRWSRAEAPPAALQAVVDVINSITEPRRSVCALRALSAVLWSMRKVPSDALLRFRVNKDNDGYLGKFDTKTRVTRDTYQVKVSLTPGDGQFEALVTHDITSDTYRVQPRDISRTNAYNDEPACISATHPHMNPFCYCIH